MEIDYNKIDSECRKMVELFNRIGLKTKHSCAGHNKLNCNKYYIMFDDNITDEMIINFIDKFENQYTHSPFLGHFNKWYRKCNGKIISNWLYEVTIADYKTNQKYAEIDFNIFTKNLEFGG